MSREHLARFLTKASADPELARSLQQQPSLAEVIAMGAEHGFEFTSDKLALLESSGGQLSDDQLESVAGGGPGNVMNGMYSVFRESIAQQNKDKKYWMNKLEVK